FGIENIIRGTLVSGEQGLFQSSKHSVNYLESHDGYTLGDFIRIAKNPEMIENVIEDKKALTKLDESSLRIAKFAALTLFVSQGITMIHAGQEWARAKVIKNEKDDNTNRLDHDSYNKDNETNWLNFDEIELNEDLFNY